MNKPLITAFLLLTPLVTLAAADDAPAATCFSSPAITLTPQERAALTIGKQWQTGMATSKPVAGADGAIQFVYGRGQTQLRCAVLQICDVALQPGEQINTIAVGDPRFSVEPALATVGNQSHWHLLIKAQDVGLDTSLVVTTSQRTYHLRLRSSRTDFMPYVSFLYPDDIQAKWLALQQQQTKLREDNTRPDTGEYLGHLDFNYTIKGHARWTPSRVYNDGVKTIIDMPPTMQHRDAPVLLVLRSQGLFKAAETVMVNYRVQQNRYIVDSVFDQAILILGVGRQQEKVTITRRSS